METGVVGYKSGWRVGWGNWGYDGGISTVVQLLSHVRRLFVTP